MENENTKKSPEPMDSLLRVIIVALAIAFVLVGITIWDNSTVSDNEVKEVNAIYSVVNQKPEKTLMDEAFLEKVKRLARDGDISELEYAWIIEHNPLNKK